MTTGLSRAATHRDPAPHRGARAPRGRPMSKIQETGDKVLANVERVIVGKHQEVIS